MAFQYLLERKISCSAAELEKKSKLLVFVFFLYAEQISFSAEMSMKHEKRFITSGPVSVSDITKHGFERF